MLQKTEKHQYFFEVKTDWLKANTGILSTTDVKDEIIVETPGAYIEGAGGNWSAEQLLLGALCSSMMSTYLALAKKKKLAVANFQCSAIGQVQITEGHLAFTMINLFPRVAVKAEKDLALANEILLKTTVQCPVANSLKSHLVQHGEVHVVPPTDHPHKNKRS